MTAVLKSRRVDVAQDAVGTCASFCMEGLVIYTLYEFHNVKQVIFTGLAYSSNRGNLKEGLSGYLRLYDYGSPTSLGIKNVWS